jgi:single-stranded DNA-binding protein
MFMPIRDCENNVKLIGYVCTNVEQIDSDPVGIRFKLITNEAFYSKKKQQNIKNSELHLIKSWKQNANFALNNINVGDHVYVDGKIHYHIITTDDNKKIRNPEIIASKITKLNRKDNIDNSENNNTETEINTKEEATVVS